MKRRCLVVTVMSLFLMSSLLCASSEAQAQSKAAKKKYVIGASLVSKDNQWWATAGKFLTQATEREGVELVLLWAGGNQEKQVKDIEDLIQRKVDGIVMGPVQQAGSMVAVDAVAEANIPIVTFGRRSNSKKANAEVFYNEAQFGINQVQQIAKDFPNGANIVYLFGPVGAGYAIQQYEDGFLKELKKYPKLKLLDTYKHENDTTALGMKNAEDALIRFSDVNVFASCNDDMGFGAIRAIEAAGKGGKIKVYGSTAVPIGLQAIYDGKMAFTNLKSTALVAAKSLDLLLKILNGEKVQKVNLIDPVAITKENLLTLKDPGFSGTIDNPGTWQPGKK
jgi:inositol transport system substrate-binding protein